MPEESAFARSAAPLGVDVLLALRTATSALHARLDAHLPIARAGASLQDYVAHLRVLQPWLLGVRQGLACHGPALDLVVSHVDAKLADLAQDLVQAGHAAQADAQAVARRIARNGEPAAFAWGLAYVLEGSQLGGAVLHRRLRERLAPHALRYLDGGEEGVAARWREFVHRLRGAVVNGASVQQAQRGAVAAFEDLIRRFGL
jgi:heme oxygenase (biliverdin-IX-beta and delta-forming)